MREVSPTDQVERAARTAQKIPNPKDRLRILHTRYGSVIKERQRLLGIEAEHTEELQDIARQTGGELGVLRYMEQSGQEFKGFPSEPFGWRDDQGLPALMPFSLESPKVSIRDTGKHQNLPRSVRPFYKDVSNLLAKKSDNELRLRELKTWPIVILICLLIVAAAMTGYLTDTMPAEMSFALVFGVCLLVYVFGIFFIYTAPDRDHMGKKHFEVQATFKGLIPDTVRQHIKQLVEAKVFDEIFILAEVPDLQITDYELPEPRSPRYGDPLVIGCKGTKFWLTNAFDTSPVEALAQSRAT